MRAYLRSQFGLGPLGLLLALPLVLIALVLGQDALRHAMTADPLRLLIVLPEVGGAWAALFLTRRLQDAVAAEVTA
ncbi:hypothetical protein L1280_002813 [Deinococcus sp. HSC-46F16]|uniref:hypothetical protein n=1 Tax=Deinococcus sp. HSC-46F16 TaxID=2910968 RepID=UPI0020A0C52B|nr:hypothetical protein [Deinococcus sp. HSC-46F16]MCP2015645.1 hypothetical protein [Deinococcus sp. HSC-46F16]